MAYFTLELQDSVYVLTMINGDKGNVMDDAWLDELTVHLDAIEADPAANRALVLALLQRDKEAKKALQAAAKAWPEVLTFLLADKVRKPKIDEFGVTPGGKDEAWIYRDSFLPLWKQSGALELARQLAGT